MNAASPSPAQNRSRRVVNAAPGATLLEAARAAGLSIGSSCAGRGACGWCRVTVTGGEIAPPDASEQALLDRLEAGVNERVACQARVLGPVTISTGYW